MRYKFLFVAISTAFITLTSCHSKSDQPLPTGPREISFSLGGEFADVTYEPLSRAANQAKYYAMNISRRSNPSKPGENYTPYAYGVFDNIDDIKSRFRPNTPINLNVHHSLKTSNRLPRSMTAKEAYLCSHSA